MRYEARVTAYDVMDSVHVVLNATDTTATPTNTVDMHLNLTVTVPGRGTDDISLWVRQALQALLEAL